VVYHSGTENALWLIKAVEGISVSEITEEQEREISDMLIDSLLFLSSDR
jgi:hypothetical protein